jgi:putative two-component system response regulator
MSHDEASRIIVEGRGSHFDPDIVDAFIAVSHEFYEIAERFRDPGVEGDVTPAHGESP